VFATPRGYFRDFHRSALRSVYSLSSPSGRPATPWPIAREKSADRATKKRTRVRVRVLQRRHYEDANIMESRVEKVPTKDRIYETITLRAARGRVWRAISEHREFGAWFGATFEQRFSPGATVTGILTPPPAGSEVATSGRARDRMPVELTVEELEPDHRVAFRWRPRALGQTAAGAREPATRVELQLENDPEGVVLTVTESFEALPRAGRASVTALHQTGWTERIELLRQHVERPAAHAALVPPRLVSYQVTETPP
jgi:uncharacterized protein YndB with AHSA1/START domain